MVAATGLVSQLASSQPIRQSVNIRVLTDDFKEECEVFFVEITATGTR